MKKLLPLLFILIIPLNAKAYDMSLDYSSLMADCVAISDYKMGEWYENVRNIKISKYGGVRWSYEDLELLSKIIEAEAGMNWLDDYIRMCVGEVVLNRVDSPEFPNTIHEVIYQEGQYHHAELGILHEVVPTEKSINTALRLLNGERVINDKRVVFQSNYILGEIYQAIYDELLGYTYLCYSSNSSLYEGISK